MKICYFGIYKPDFTRSRVIIAALESQGIEVVQCVDHTPSLKKYLRLAQKHRQLKGDYDAMLVGFPGYFVMFLARIITRKPIIFDAYISYYDGLLDRRAYSPSHPRMLVARVVDYLAVTCSKVTLTINEAYKSFFIETLGASASKMEVLHKGADESRFRPGSSHEGHSGLRILWWGTYIPLHGLEYVIEAANLLRNRADIDFVLIGKGQLRTEIQDKTHALKLTNVSFRDALAPDELVREIQNADVTLGLFNDTPKALRCVTNKVYEAMAIGKAIITEESPASLEIFTHKENVYLVPPADPHALAHAIEELGQEPSLRYRIAQGALELFLRRFTTRMIGIEFLDILGRHGIYRPTHKDK